MAKKMAATATRGKGDLAVVPSVETAEVQLVQLDASAISRWVGGIHAFFKQAQELELRAKSYLMRAEGLRVPTTGDQDQQLQDFIRIGNAEKKENEAHWGIAGVLDKLHKRAVQGRRRGSDAYDQGNTIANRLHNTFVDAERRRAEEESNRLRREAEDREAKARQEALDHLEREALKAEASSPALSSREQEFVDRVWHGGNAPTVAAKYAGYKDPEATAARLMNTPKIKAAIDAKRVASQARQQATAIKESPVEVESTLVDVKPDTRGGDRTTWSGEVLNLVAFRNAAFEGTHGIPRDCFSVDQAALTKHAQSMHEQMDRWPGVRAKRTTKVV